MADASSRRRSLPRGTTLTALASGFLLLLCALFAFPFLWMILATFKANPQIFSPFPLLPEEFHLRHYRALLSGEWIPYPRQFLNSLFIAGVQTLLAVGLSAAAGFAFAKHSFRGKRALFALAVLVVLIPRQVMVLPLFTWMNDLSLLDGPWSVIWPGAVSGIGVIYFTQVCKRLPDELLDMARSEGASEYRVFISILPLIKPALIAYGLIHFILAWHEHLIPLVMLSTPEHMTAGVALSSLYGSSLRIPYGLLMAGSAMTVAPTALLYLLVQKHFKSSLAELTLQ
ncbi:MAG: binding-protein-dependent transport system inner rane component [Fibrobacteres bacterium]|nr:binding-protein-dependent transport system inner rane component [Fibrobacterota bacterium]